MFDCKLKVYYFWYSIFDIICLCFFGPGFRVMVTTDCWFLLFNSIIIQPKVSLAGIFYENVNNANTTLDTTAHTPTMEY